MVGANITYFDQMCEHYSFNPKYLKFIHKKGQLIVLYRCTPNFTLKNIAELMKQIYGEEYIRWNQNTVTRMFDKSVSKMRTLQHYANLMGVEEHINEMSWDEIQELKSKPMEASDEDI